MPSLQTEIAPNTKCVIVGDIADDMDVASAQLFQVATTFTLNFFSALGSVLIGRGFIISEKRTFKVVQDFLFSPPFAINSHARDKFRLRETTTPVDIQKLFESSYSGVTRDKTLRVTLSRFNSAVLKNEQSEERAIDLSICLESVFKAQTEVSFRFALYNTLLSVQDLGQRLEPFRLLKRLYKYRSDIVHGSVVNYEWSEDDWTKVIALAKAAILYKVQYVERFDPSNWQEHLDHLSLGSAANIWA
jgi:hypothetical protein